MYTKRRLNVKSKSTKRPIKRTRTKSKPKLSLNLESKIKSIVKRSIGRNMEKKQTAEIVADRKSFYSYEYNTTGPTEKNLYEIFPLNTVYNTIVPGVGQGGRIGNKITASTNKVSYTLSCAPISTDWRPSGTSTHDLTYAAPPYYILALMLKRKDGTINTNPDTLTDLYQFGSTSQAPTMKLEDLNLYINKDVYTVLYKKIHKLYPSFGSTDTNLDSSSVPSDVKTSANASIYITKHIKKTLHYDDESTQVEDEPSTNIFMVFLPIAITASSLNTNSENPSDSDTWPWLPVLVSIQHQFQYTDA